MGMAIATIIGAIITAVVGAVVTGVSNEQERIQNAEIARKQEEIAKAGFQKDLQISEEANKTQKEINEANIANQNEQNAIMRAREDNAVQRRAWDLQAAGINPMLAGVQGASAQPGFLALQQAPLADTSIGSRYATNMIDILKSFGLAEQGRRNRTQEGTNAIINNATAVTKNIAEISKSRFEEKLLKAQYDNLRADEKKKFAEVVKLQADTEKVLTDKIKSESETNYLNEMITSEPIKRAMVEAQTEKEWQSIKEMQKRIKVMHEQQVSEVIEQTRKLQQIEIDKEIKAKVQKEVELLALDGDIARFERDMQKLDKVTETSKSYVEMFTSLVKSIFIPQFNISSGSRGSSGRSANAPRRNR